MFTDSHCHLNFPPLRGDLTAIRAAMAAAQVTRALCICTKLEEFADVHGLSTQYDNFWSTVGVHPDEEEVQEPSVGDLVDRAQLAKVVAIGETGLDYFDMPGRKGGRSVADLEWQRERFRVHIRAARACNLPLVIHTRDASDDTLAILREEGGFGPSPTHCGVATSDCTHQRGQALSAARGVFHCFTESMAVAKAALDLGFYISFSGILTFKAAAALREVARYVPLDRCLIETDSPYLAPAPHRGKTNSPAYVPIVAQQIAEAKNIELAVVAQATSDNFDTLFTKVNG